jgi:hypothetical protein
MVGFIRRYFHFRNVVIYITSCCLEFMIFRESRAL